VISWKVKSAVFRRF
jgi:hypothetical protein